jgi:hypothetical protein
LLWATFSSTPLLLLLLLLVYLLTISILPLKDFLVTPC